MSAAEVAAALQARARPQTKQRWERYLNGAVAFRGVRTVDIRAVVHDLPIDSLDDALAQLPSRTPRTSWRASWPSGRIMPRLSAADVPRLAEPFAHIDDVRDPARFSQTAVGWLGAAGARGVSAGRRGTSSSRDTVTGCPRRRCAIAGVR